MTEMRSAFLLVAALSLFAPAWAAHVCTGDPLPDDKRNEFELWGGFSPRSGGPISSTMDHHFTVAGVQYSRRCWSWNKVSLNYNVSVLPVALVRVPPEGVYALTLPPSQGGVFIIGFSSFFPSAPAHTVYGFAATPVGLTLDAWRTRRIYPFAQADGGFIKSTEPVPYTTFNLPATSFNFLLSLGGGVKIRTSKLTVLSFGYKLMHLSNGGRTAFNPGLDNNVVFAGISLLK